MSALQWIDMFNQLADCRIVQAHYLDGETVKFTTYTGLTTVIPLTLLISTLQIAVDGQLLCSSDGEDE